MALVIAITGAGCLNHTCTPSGGFVSWLQEDIRSDLEALHGNATLRDNDIVGVPVNATATAAFLGMVPRLNYVAAKDIYPAVVARWQEGGVWIRASVYDARDDPEAVRSGVESVLTGLANPSDAAAWVEMNMPALGPGETFEVPVDLPINLTEALDNATASADATWSITRLVATLEVAGLTWNLRFSPSYFEPIGLPQIWVIGDDRVVVQIREDAPSPHEAFAFAEPTLDAYAIEADPSMGLTWAPQKACS